MSLPTTPTGLRDAGDLPASTRGVALSECLAGDADAIAPPRPRRVLIVDDDAAIRRLVRRVVERVPSLVVVGEASNGTEALEQALQDPPDIVLTDIAMPGMDGVELTRRLLEAHPATRVLALTGAEPGAALLAMIRYGAVGYLVKTASIEEMLQALEAVSRGLCVLSPEATSWVLADLGKHYRAEQARAEALTELDTMKRDFMNLVSHELRTPVTIIKGGVQTLRRGGPRLDPNQQGSFFDSIERNCQRLQRMIDQILIVSRIDTKPVRPSAIDLQEVVSGVLGELSAEHRSRVIASVRPARILGSRSDLVAVVGWIVDNALAFGEGEIRVSSAPAHDGYVILQVEDHGIGMRDELIERVLTQPFTQQDPSITRGRDGLGLSLYAGKQIVESVGGSLKIESEPGAGTTVSLHLQGTAFQRAGVRGA